MLEHKSGNVSETRKDRAKDTIKGPKELIDALSNHTYGLLFPKIGGSQPPAQTPV